MASSPQGYETSSTSAALHRESTPSPVTEYTDDVRHLRMQPTEAGPGGGGHVLWERGDCLARRQAAEDGPSDGGHVSDPD
jgi:hypothetical protein